MNIVKILVPESKYNIKCPYTMTPTRIVVHNTANDAPAENEASYMMSNNEEVSFHYVVDDNKVIQCIPENRNAWHSGDGGKGKGNREGIAIEICYSYSKKQVNGKWVADEEKWNAQYKTKFAKAEANAVELIVDILKRYGWGIDKVTKHQDYSNKYCPHRTLDLGWDRFIKMVDEKLNPPITLYRVRKSWDDAKSQVGAFRVLKNAKAVCKPGYHVFDESGKIVYSPKAPATENPAVIKVGSTVTVNKGAKTYTGGGLASYVYNRKHIVKEIKGDRVVITYSGVVVAAINIKDLTLA